MHTDKAIAEFEAWASSEAFGLSPAHFAKDEAGDYINYPTQCYWLVWQASREELVVQLPDDGIDDCREAWPGRCRDTFDCGYNFASWRHEQAIEAAGVTVKE